MDHWFNNSLSAKNKGYKDLDVTTRNQFYSAQSLIKLSQQLFRTHFEKLQTTGDRLQQGIKILEFWNNIALLFAETRVEGLYVEGENAWN